MSKDKTWEKIAYHEAGHAVMAYTFDAEIKNLSIETEFNSYEEKLGQLKSESKMPCKKTASAFWEYLEKYSLIALGGIAAEHIYEGKPEKIDVGGGGQDLKNIQRLFGESIKMELTVQQIIDMFFDRAVEILDNNWQAVEALAKSLVKSRSLSAKDVLEIIKTP
jgi:ATP-dependent Zn protease